MYAHLRKQRGFTLVELMIVVAIVGVLAALAIYGVRRYIANAKTAEARNALGQISKDSTSAYAREHMSGEVLKADGTDSAKVANQLCVDGPKVPATVPAGEKWQSNPADWKDGWSCLRYSMTDPQYYQYEYDNDNDKGFNAIAVGDLDGDGDQATFTLKGAIDDTSKELLVAPNILEDKPEE